MILDDISNLRRYDCYGPLFSKAIDFVLSTDLQSLKPGRIVLQGDDLFVNVQFIDAKGRADAPTECHADYIDIQVPVSADEEMGYTQGSALGEASVPYSKEKDVAFYPGLSETYLKVRRGMFTVFFPGEGHAPGISENGVLKFIIKIKK